MYTIGERVDDINDDMSPLPPYTEETSDDFLFNFFLFSQLNNKKKILTPEIDDRNINNWGGLY